MSEDMVSNSSYITLKNFNLLLQVEKDLNHLDHISYCQQNSWDQVIFFSFSATAKDIITGFTENVTLLLRK
jgi:hypothetical protein